MANINVENLTKYFGRNVAVDGINLEVASGELIALLGSSGCGKTTFLRLLAGFLEPDAGQIIVGSRLLSSKQKTVAPENRNMGMIFQSFAIWSHMSVFENVAFGLRIRNLSQSEILKRVERALEITYLEKIRDRYPSQLSGGQQQRVALARAIVIRPQILLLDEPLSNLDATLRDELRQEVRRIHNETNLTTIYVTHDRSEALALADRIVVMSDGSIQQVGTPEEVYERPATEFVARFISRCNVLSGILGKNRVDVGGIVIETKSDVLNSSIGHEVSLCIRPQFILLKPIDEYSDINCFSASVEQHIYLGDEREYKVSIVDTRLLLSVVTPLSVRFDAGDRVNAIVPPEHCRLINQTKI